MRKINLIVIALMEGGMAPTKQSYMRLLDLFFPERDNLNITLLGGLTWADPKAVAKAINKNTVVATIYNLGGDWRVDRVDGKRLKALKKMLLAAEKEETSWDVAMRYHELETSGK